MKSTFSSVGPSLGSFSGRTRQANGISKQHISISGV